MVGGGFTGLWTAIELKRRDPSTEVTLIEAAVCGAGASGANGGMAMNLWPKLSALIKQGGEDEAVAVARASVKAVDYLINFCEDNAIDAQIYRTGWLWASTNRSQDNSWDPAVEAAASYRDSPFRVLDGQAASKLAGTRVRGGVVDDSCANLHPGLLVRGLARVAESMGIRIYEHTPLRALGSNAHAPVAITPFGEIRAASVVLAINAWATQIPSVRQQLVMTASDNIVVKPAPGSYAPVTTAAGVSDAGRLLDYWRPLEDGTWLFGKAGLGLGYRTRGASTLFRPAPRLDNLIKQMHREFPALQGSTMLSAWRAPVEYSLSSLPFFSNVPGYPRVFYGTGYSGDGVGPCVMGGWLLASLATGVKDELSESFLTRSPKGRRLPPEPIRFLGGQVVKAAMIRRDRLEDQQKRVDPVTRMVTLIDPTSFVG